MKNLFDTKNIGDLDKAIQVAIGKYALTKEGHDYKE